MDPLLRQALLFLIAGLAIPTIAIILKAIRFRKWLRVRKNRTDEVITNLEDSIRKLAKSENKYIVPEEASRSLFDALWYAYEVWSQENNFSKLYASYIAEMLSRLIFSEMRHENSNMEIVDLIKSVNSLISFVIQDQPIDDNLLRSALSVTDWGRTPKSQNKFDKRSKYIKARDEWNYTKIALDRDGNTNVFDTYIHNQHITSLIIDDPEFILLIYALETCKYWVTYIPDYYFGFTLPIKETIIDIYENALERLIRGDKIISNVCTLFITARDAKRNTLPITILESQTQLNNNKIT